MIPAMQPLVLQPLCCEKCKHLGVCFQSRGHGVVIYDITSTTVGAEVTARKCMGLIDLFLYIVKTKWNEQETIGG